MTELFSWFAFFPPFPTGELFKQLLAAGVGTAAFSVLFYVPRKYYGFCFSFPPVFYRIGG